jgi:DNA-directed RNA polymerase specialized sigma24 family protein
VTTKVEGFDRLIEPLRSELLAYCYQLPGSSHDAENLVQGLRHAALLACWSLGSAPAVAHGARADGQTGVC